MKEQVAHDAVQMSGRYPRDLAEEAHDFAIDKKLSLNVLLVAALAEYLARRHERDADPRPQLHHRPGRPPAESIRRQAELMRVDRRGRKLHQRGSRATTAVHGEATPSAAARPGAPLADHSADGTPARHASDDPAQVRQEPAGAARLHLPDGDALPLAS